MKEHQEGRGTAPPGTERGKRLRPKFHYELIGCGLRGHELLGTDVATIRPVDDLLVREPGDGLRWYRCVRCDAWVPLAPPLALPARPSISLSAKYGSSRLCDSCACAGRAHKASRATQAAVEVRTRKGMGLLRG